MADPKMLANALLGHSSTKYWTALGAFIDSFSHVEIAMHLFLIQRAGVTMQVGNSIFSGTRVADAIANVRRIYAAKNGGEELRGELHAVLSQLQAINSARNEIVHYGTQDVGAKERLMTNALRAHTGKNIKALPISVETLDDMNADTNRITSYLLGSMTDDPKMRHVLMAHDSPIGAWRYTPPKAESPKQRQRTETARNNKLARRAQRRAAREKG